MSSSSLPCLVACAFTVQALVGCRKELKSGCEKRPILLCAAADPVYKYLKQQQKGMVFSDIKWNFSKFLVDRDGNVVKRCVKISLADACIASIGT